MLQILGALAFLTSIAASSDIPADCGVYPVEYRQPDDDMITPIRFMPGTDSVTVRLRAGGDTHFDVRWSYDEYQHRGELQRRFIALAYKPGTQVATFGVAAPCRQDRLTS